MHRTLLSQNCSFVRLPCSVLLNAIFHQVVYVSHFCLDPHFIFRILTFRRFMTIIHIFVAKACRKRSLGASFFYSEILTVPDVSSGTGNNIRLREYSDVAGAVFPNLTVLPVFRRKGAHRYCIEPTFELGARLAALAYTIHLPEGIAY